VPESLLPELIGDYCSIADCLETADVMGRATIEVNPLDGPPEQDSLTLGFPHCFEHAHRLRMGGRLVDLESGL